MPDSNSLPVRLRQLISDQDMNMSSLHRRMNQLFGGDTIAYMTLYRTIHGLTEIRDNSLFQIATALGTTPEMIRAEEEKAGDWERLVYNKNAYFDIDPSQDLPFLTGRLVLLAGGRTPVEQDISSKKKPVFKWIYGLKGTINCVVQTAEGAERLILDKHERVCIDSTQPHYFENPMRQKCSVLIIQHPRQR